jgi:hypothetical protein
MKNFIRNLVCVTAGVSALLCAAFRVRSYSVRDEVMFERTGLTGLISNRGVLRCVREDYFVPWDALASDRQRWTYSERVYLNWDRDLPRPNASGGALGFSMGRDDQRWADRLDQRTIVQAPYWAAVLLLGIPAVWRFRTLARVAWRHRRGLCAACGYPGERERECCPECGEVPGPAEWVPSRAERVWALVWSRLLVKHPRGLALTCGACVLLVGVGFWGRHLQRLHRTDAEQFRDLVAEVCVDSGGNMDRNILDGTWQQATADIDLNGDGVPERLILFYDWGRWGNTPAEGAAGFGRECNASSGWLVRAVLILSLQGAQWRAAAYDFQDENGMWLSVEESTTTHLPILVTGGDNPCRAWGASSRAGRSGRSRGWRPRAAEPFRRKPSPCGRAIPSSPDTPGDEPPASPTNGPLSALPHSLVPGAPV